MSDAQETLVEHPVDIVTSFASGPRAIRYAPPGYNSERPFTMAFGYALGTMGSPYM